MERIDVFNGDADGICALHQLRLQNPTGQSRLVTGVKRDITLLDRLTSVKEAAISVLDISLDRNRDSLLTILNNHNTVFYVDHHFAGDIPSSGALTTCISAEPTVCTSLLINDFIDHRYAAWAVVGAFGDNLDETARNLAKTIGVKTADLSILKEIGILLNYNGYGASLEDLFFSPADLYLQVHPYKDPLDFAATSSTLQTLRDGYQDDMNKARSLRPALENTSGRIYELPATPWARRVSGVFANTLARDKPDAAHALITTNSDGSLRMSVRAPLDNRTGADTLCRQFPTGGGRAAAAGINELPADQFDAFIQAFIRQFSG